MAAVEGKNEHAIKWVIDSVDALCDEYTKVKGPWDVMHLELSTVKVLDELEMPTIEHAKNEVVLITRLLSSLNRLIEHCESVLDSSEVTGRLKGFREGMQSLFVMSPVCTITKLSGSRTKGGHATGRAQGRKTEDRTNSVEDPERTKTPTEEAQRPGHELDRSDRVTELDDSVLRKIREQFSAKKGPSKDETSTSDTKATRTRTPAFAVDDPEEQSQRIWVEDDLSTPPSLPFLGSASEEARRPSPKPLLAKPRLASPAEVDHAPTDAGRSRSGGGGLDLPDEVDGPEEVQCTPDFCPIKLNRRPKAATKGAIVVKQLSNRLPIRIKPKCAMGIVAASLVLLWLIFEWKNPCCGCRMTGWQILCSLANTFCEHYGSGCTPYCASGMQLLKWQRSRR